MTVPDTSYTSAPAAAFLLNAICAWIWNGLPSAPVWLIVHTILPLDGQ